MGRTVGLVGRFVGVVLAVAALLGACSSGPSAEQSAARKVCVASVRSRLGTEPDAFFKGDTVYDYVESAGRLTVAGVVDSDGGMAVPVKTAYRCTASRTSSGWAVAKLTVG